MKKALFSSLLFVGLALNAQAQEFPEDIKPLMTKYTCTACHKVDTKLVGPAYTEVAKRKYTDERIVELIAAPKPSNWPGYPPMAALKVPKEDALKIAGWINSLAPKKKAKKS
ncbi:MAG: cytochrome C [Arcicella sp.]|jgi:cytochrome c|nr:cytochrome C [Arcicella sp.]